MMFTRQFKKLAAGFLLGGFLITGALAGVGYAQARATTTTGVVTIRQIISGSLSFASGTTLKLADGSAGAPSLTFSSQTTTGFFKPADAQIGITFAGAGRYFLNGGDFTISSGGAVGFSASADPTGTGIETGLYRDAANALAQRNGTNAQKWSVYNTYTSATNNEFGGLDWTLNANELFVGTRKGSGGGSARSLMLGTDSVRAFHINTLGALGPYARNTATVNGATTFAVNGSYMVLECTGAETINTITGASTGTILWLENSDTECTIADDDSATATDAIDLTGTAANDVGAVAKVIGLIYNGTHWLQIFESDN